MMGWSRVIDPMHDYEAEMHSLLMLFFSILAVANFFGRYIDLSESQQHFTTSRSTYNHA